MSTFTDSHRKEGITFLDVGQGDCTHIKTASGKNILIDGGGEMNRDIGNAVLKPYLLKNGTKMIDLAILTHLHRDHYDGLFEIARQGMVKKLIVTKYHRDKVNLISKATKMNKKDIVFLTAPHKINLDKGVSMDMMYPKEDVSEKQGEKNIADGNLKGSESEIVFSMVRYPADVRSVYLGENGLVSGAARKAILVDMTTSEPALPLKYIHQSYSLLC